MTSRAPKDHVVPTIEMSGAEDTSHESDAFISSPAERQSYSPLPPRGCRSIINAIGTATRTICINNRIARWILGILRSIIGPIVMCLRVTMKVVPPDLWIHLFTVTIVTIGTLTLFLSPMFRSRLSAMRERPLSMENGVIDAMAFNSDQYAAVLENIPGVPVNIPGNVPQTCTESYFRCEYYWASDTNDASNGLNTAYCSAYVCKGMTVTVSVLPQSCSRHNRVAIGVLMKEIYSKPVYSCGNSGCGECSTLRYHSLEDGVVSLLQGCNEDHSCYGQVEVALTWDHPAMVASSKMKNKAPWPGFRGGQLSQSVTRVSSKPGGPSLRYELSAGGFRSSPAVSSSGIAYIGSDDKYLYAVKANGKLLAGTIVWKFLTTGMIRSSPILSTNEKAIFFGCSDHYFYAVDSINGNLIWRYATGGEVISSPALGVDNSILTIDNTDPFGVLYIGCNDGFLYAISTTGALKWKFSTLIPTTSTSLSPIKSSPCISPDESTIYFGADNSVLYAVSNAGLLKWQFRTYGAITSSPTVSTDGLSIYFGSDDMHIYSISSTGTLKWRYLTDNSISSSPALFKGVIYIGSTATDLRKGGAGKVKITGGKRSLSDTIHGDHSLTSSEITAQAAQTDHHEELANEKLASEHNEHRHKHHRRSLNNILTNFNDNFNRIIYVGAPKQPIIKAPKIPRPSNATSNTTQRTISPAAQVEGGHLYAITVQGKLLWRFKVPKGVVSSPLIGADGSVFFGSKDGTLFSLGPGGTLKWLYKTPGGSISGTPGIDSDGTIYVGSEGESGSGSGVGGVGGVNNVSDGAGAAGGSGRVSSGRLSVISITPASATLAKITVSNFTSQQIESTASDTSWMCSIDSRNTLRKGISSVEKMCARSGSKTTAGIKQKNRRNLKGSLQGSLHGSINGNLGENMEENLRRHMNRRAEKISRRNLKSVEGDTAEKKRLKKDTLPSQYSCLPGLSEYIGNGVDITLQKDDSKFVTTRLFELSSIKRIQNLYGWDYLAPPVEKLSVTSLDEIEASNPIYSGAFTGVRAYTLKQSLSFNLGGNDYIKGRFPLGTVSSIIANSSGTWNSIPEPSMARVVSNHAVKGKMTLINTATYTHTRYDLLPQPGVGQLCSLNFIKDIDRLSDPYEEKGYLSFIKRYGTHIIIGATFGGTISAVSTFDPCLLNPLKGPKTPEEIFENYKKEIGDFTVYGKQSEITVLGQIIKRDEMVVCGGVESDFKKGGPFADWAKGTVLRNDKLCVVTFYLLPIYASIPVENPSRLLIESAVLNYMNLAKNYAALNVTEISSCKKI